MALLTAIHMKVIPSMSRLNPPFPTDVLSPIAGGIVTLADGVASGCANRCHVSLVTIPPSDEVLIDLYGDATFKDRFEQPIDFVKIKTLYVRASDANVHGLEVGAAASAAWEGPFGAATVPLTFAAKGKLMLSHETDGWAVVPTTGDIFRLGNAGAVSPITAELCLVGTDS